MLSKIDNHINMSYFYTPEIWLILTKLTNQVINPFRKLEFYYNVNQNKPSSENMLSKTQYCRLARLKMAAF